MHFRQILRRFILISEGLLLRRALMLKLRRHSRVASVILVWWRRRHGLIFVNRLKPGGRGLLSWSLLCRILACGSKLSGCLNPNIWLNRLSQWCTCVSIAFCLHKKFTSLGEKFRILPTLLPSLLWILQRMGKLGRCRGGL